MMYNHSAIFAYFTLSAAACFWGGGSCAYAELVHTAKSEPPIQKAYQWSRGEAETGIVDLLIAYDRSAQNWLAANGLGTVETHALNAVANLNEGISSTGIDGFFQFRLAGTVAIPVDFSGRSIISVLCYHSGEAKAKSEDELSAVSTTLTARDNHAADIVAVLVDKGGASPYGVSYKLTKAYLSASGLDEMAEQAYCVCDISTLSERHTLMHEIGHIFGAGHDREQNSDPGPQLQSYSAACRFEHGGLLHTSVMGTMSSGGKTYVRWPFFSSPLYAFADSDIVVGSETRHDNTRTLCETYGLVSNFRVATPLPDAADETPAIEISASLVLESGREILIEEGATVQAMRYVSKTLMIATATPGNAKTVVTVKGLPSGMKYSAKTGLVTGFPKKTGFHAVTVTAKCAGMSKRMMRFGLSVSDIPSSLPGKYIGLVNINGCTALMTMSLTKSGKSELSGRVNGKSIKLSAPCIANTSIDIDGETALEMHMSGKSGKVVQELPVTLAGRRTRSTGFDGVLHQVPWGRKDVTAPKITKKISATAGDCLIRIRNGGKAYVKCSRAEASSSGVFQMTSANANGDGGALYLLPVALPNKGKFPGYFGELTVKLTVDGKNRVTGIEAISENVMQNP